ncbi:peptide chain release factor 2 [Phosphitispora sp. TUW77]
MLADLKKDMEILGKRIEDLRVSLDFDEKLKKTAELEACTTKDGFWDEPEAAQKVMQEINRLQTQINDYIQVLQRYDDVNVLWQLSMEEGDESLEKEVTRDMEELEAVLSEMELVLLLSGPYDRANAVISLHAGAGGTEAQDWVEMLLRMYTRWAGERHYGVETLDFLPGDEAGVKSASLLITGENVYGYLKSEKGVHRLVRISPFDASGRRHTSFASVDVLPEVEDDNQVVIDTGDLKIDTYRSGGAGGQHVNKTDSAVRITHLPTGIVVQCQNERSQHANRLKAMKLLHARLLDLQLKQKEEELSAIRGEQQDIAWGSQIRSYIFQPYTLVKDHRTGVEIGNVESVTNGNIDLFISGYLQLQAKRR